MSTTRTQTGTSNRTATFARQPGAESPDIDTLRNQEFGTDPTIPYAAAAARNRMKSSIVNPLGGYDTAQTRTARETAGNRAIDEQQAMATRAGSYDVNQQKYQRNAYLAGLTAPPLVQTGESGTNTGAYKTPFSAKILPALQAGAGFAAAG